MSTTQDDLEARLDAMFDGKVCPACHHHSHDPGSCPACPRCELHTDEALAFVLRVEPELLERLRSVRDGGISEALERIAVTAEEVTVYQHGNPMTVLGDTEQRIGEARTAVVIEMENEGVVTWGDPGHRARFLAVPPALRARIEALPRVPQDLNDHGSVRTPVAR